MLWGKLNVGINVQGGYPPPAWPHAGGAAILALGDAEDQAYVGLKPDAAENNDSITLMFATHIDQNRRARLYVINTHPLPIYCNAIKLMAIQLESLDEDQSGQRATRYAPREEQEEEHIRTTLFRAEPIRHVVMEKLLKDTKPHSSKAPKPQSPKAPKPRSG
jgi:hypothetical protein